MMKPKTYLQALKKTFTTPSYYLILMKTKRGFSLRFFLTSFLILGLTLALKITTVDIPKIKQSLLTDGQSIVKYFPEDLVLEWKNNNLETFQKQSNGSLQEYSNPITLDYPKIFEDQKDSLPLTFLTYVNTDDSIEQISTDITSPSLIVVTKKNIFTKNIGSKNLLLDADEDANGDSWNHGELNSFLSETGSWQISKNTIDGQYETFKDELNNDWQALNTAVFIVTPILLTINRLLFLINLIFIFIIIKINRLNISFKQLLKISLHVLVISETINQISNILYPNLEWSFFSFSFYAIIAFIFFYICNIKKMIYCLVKKRKK